MKKTKLFIALLVTFQFSMLPLANAGVQTQSPLVKMANGVKKQSKFEKPTIDSTLKYIKQYIPKEKFKILKRSIDKKRLNDRIDIEVQGKVVTLRTDDSRVRITFIGDREKYLSVNGVNVSIDQLKELEPAIKKIEKNFKVSKADSYYSSGVLALLSSTMGEAKAFNWALFGGLALIGLGLGAAGYFVSRAKTTHNVVVDPIKVDPIVVEPIEGELKVPISIEVPQINSTGMGTGGTFGRPRVR